MPYHPKSESAEWRTPPDLFEKLDKEFHFTLDPAATSRNALCRKFFTKKDNGLKQAWSRSRVFLNPPYGKLIHHWVRKAYYEGMAGSATVVCLLPARTDTKWFADYVLRGEVRFIKGRLTFSGKGRAPFPSMVVIFRRYDACPKISGMAMVQD